MFPVFSTSSYYFQDILYVSVQSQGPRSISAAVRLGGFYIDFLDGSLFHVLHTKKYQGPVPTPCDHLIGLSAD